MWSFRDGQTLGQGVLRIQVLDRDGTPLSGGRAVWRVLATWILLGGCYFVPFLQLVALCSMLWNDERRTWFDRWSDTRVVWCTSVRPAPDPG
jgi:uncharacterized RDD family membrane protein YckC